MKKTTASSVSLIRPPIVAVLGHVDHGKTTLLDTIRKSTVAASEHGGITQHIGAYQVTLEAKKGEGTRKITFIDTPGHEAFIAMRSRGATIADIALLVVAADDSVKPQTEESIKQIKASGATMIVVINKIDLPAANIDKVKQDLAKHGVQVEGFGGEIPVVALSAKAGTGVSDLLELIYLVAEMKEFKEDEKAPLRAVVVETQLDKHKGKIATVIVQEGTLMPGTKLYEFDKEIGNVRAMNDDHGQRLTIATPSTPVEILGFTKLPQVGSLIWSSPQAAKVQEVKPVAATPGAPFALPDFLKPVNEQEQQKLHIILKADTQGSLEAIKASLDPRINVVQEGFGDISEQDILTAKSSKAFVVGFQIKTAPAVQKLAETEKVVWRIYTIIYELLDELTDVVSGMKEVISQERELGVGTIIAEFPFEGQRVAGTKITAGRLAKGDTVKLVREDQEVNRAKIKSLRHGKDDVTKAEKGTECGILFDKKLDFLLGDGIIAVTRV